MNAQVFDFYRKEVDGKIVQPLILSEQKLSWEQVQKMAPSISRGWYELSSLTLTDRIAFSFDFWQKLLPYNPSFHPFLEEFFASLEDVGVVLLENTAEMVYSLKDNSTFFRGLMPAGDLDLDELKLQIKSSLPHDYLSFLKIHNGFGKLTEIGLLPSLLVPETKRRLMKDLLTAERSVKQGEKWVDPASLIPFYESSGFSFQCFYSDWYPGSEMGNVYLSGIDYTISETAEPRAWDDQMAFAAFLDWFEFYLEGNSLD